MRIEEIIQMPTTYVEKEKEACHESLLRSFHIVEHIRKMCEQKVPHEYMLEIIEHLSSHKGAQ